MPDHGTVLERVGEMDAVTVGEFAVMQAFQYVVSVVDVLTVRLLYASAHGSIVFGYGKSYQGTVVKLYGALNQTLAERTAAYYCCTVPILNCARYNLAGRCGVLVNKHHKFAVTETSATVGQITATGRTPALGINHHLVTSQKLVGNADGSHQQTSAVTLQVQDK